MEDDIDIEEHDVLDNPLIKNMFPDISKLKREITDFDMGFNNFTDTESPCDSKRTSWQVMKSPADGKTREHINTNKIIIGSKPNIKISNSKIHVKDDHNNIEYYEKHVKPFRAKVLLQNIGPSLDLSSKFCQICKILFSTDDHYVKHKISHCDNQTDVINGDPEGIYELVETSFCRHCSKNFSSQQLLIDHIYKVLQTEPKVCETCQSDFTCLEDLAKHKKSVHNITNEINELNSKQNEDLKQCYPNERKVYRCQICSTYFKEKVSFTIHLNKKHGLSVTGAELQSFYSNCKFCPYKARNIGQYNLHVSKQHKERLNRSIKDKHEKNTTKGSSKINNMICDEKKIKDKPKNMDLENGLSTDRNTNMLKKSNVPMTAIDSYPKTNITKNINTFLTSILYKCTRCDIHFLSSKDALNHAQHMDMLINWKCSICHRIFKKENDGCHTQQHLHFKMFQVYDVNETVASKLLYKCKKCAVHYSESEYLCHYSSCGTKRPASSFCEVCVMLIDNSIKSVHKKSHTEKGYQFDDFVIIQADVILDENITESEKLSAETTDTLNYKNNSKCSPSIVLKPSQNDKNKHPRTKQCSNKSLTGPTDLAITYFCCDNCKCFVNINNINYNKRLLHLKGSCLQIVKQVCKDCGLTLTTTGIRSHLKLHQQYDLRLQDFIFYDYKTKRKVCPMAPLYFKCKYCSVHFMSRESKAQHICSDLDDDYLTCPICQIKLSDSAFKLHVPFHMYNVKSNDAKQGEQNITKLGETNKATVNEPIRKGVSNDSSMHTPYILYKCLSCYITVDTYDKVVEHCQEHYNQNERQISLVVCKTCNLSFEDNVYSSHEKLHSLNHANFTVLMYDTFYFRFSNDIWKNHLFKKLSKVQVQQILSDSIYKFEARIKMDVIQSGKSEFTVYKCAKCQCYIDYPCLYSHADNSCFKVRPHSCTFCGLNFISLVSRTHHEKIHKNRIILLKYYRIILFNQEKDYEYNKSISSCNYDLLYQCRNCNVTGSKALLKFHECSATELKQCSECGLLLSHDEFKMHMDKHKELESYNHKIIKVVLVGVSNKREGAKSVSSFKGTVYDYSFFECSECKVCFKQDQLKLKHICGFGTSKSICPKCDLYFSSHSIKHHIKLHSIYPDFSRENMRLLKYTKPAETPLENTASELSSDPVNIKNDAGVIVMKSSMDEDMDEDVDELVCLSDDSSSGSVVITETGDIETEAERVVSLFKCSCGLHFLNLDNRDAHRKTCNKVRISKQNCSKCGLLFTPKELFDHLVKHHSNKNCIFTYSIVTN